MARAHAGGGLDADRHLRRVVRRVPDADVAVPVSRGLRGGGVAGAGDGLGALLGRVDLTDPGLPQVDTAAYRRSSPIYHAEGLRDALLIEHGLVDDNVHFQDTARLVQRLLELEKRFEVMYYPMEPHVVESEVARYDQVQRAAGFFERNVLRRGGR